MAAPSISVAYAENSDTIRFLTSWSQTNWSPEAILPSNTWISGFTSLHTSAASLRRLSSALKKNTGICGICPLRYPNPVASISCCTTSVERTISPILIFLFKLPAIPVLMIASTENTSARIWAQIPAFTLPIPERTTTTFFPASIPS